MYTNKTNPVVNFIETRLLENKTQRKIIPSGAFTMQKPIMVVNLSILMRLKYRLWLIPSSTSKNGTNLKKHLFLMERLGIDWATLLKNVAFIFLITENSAIKLNLIKLQQLSSKIQWKWCCFDHLLIKSISSSSYLVQKPWSVQICLSLKWAWPTATYTVFWICFECEQHYSKLSRCFSTAVIICNSWFVKNPNGC